MDEAQTYYLKLKEELGLILERINVSGTAQVNVEYYDVLLDSHKRTKATSIPDLKIELSDIIYHYYKKLAKVRSAGRNFLTILQKSYASDSEKSPFRDGWTLEANPYDNYGSILVTKDNYYKKQILPGAYVSETYPLQTDMPVSVRWHITSNNDVFVGKEVNAYYEVSGQHIPNDYVMSDVLIRFYFSLNPSKSNFEKRISEFFEHINKELNARFIPYQFKTIYEEDVMNRADCAVLYVEKRHFFAVIDFIHLISRRYDDILGKETPMFTFPLANGIGFCEQPPLDKADNLHFEDIPSFGQHRSAIIAYNIIDWYLDSPKNLKDPEELIQYISKANTTAGTIIINTLRDSGISAYGFGPIDSAFFLNKKSSKYPYVSSYFGLKFDKEDFLCDHDPAEDKLRQTLELIGYKLCSEAIWDAYNRCSWVEFHEGTFRTLDNSLVNGLTGILIFLSSAFEETKNISFDLHLRGAARCLSYRIFDKIEWARKNRSKHIFERTRLAHGYFEGDLQAIVTLIRYNLESVPDRDFNPGSIVERLQISDAATYSVSIYDGMAGTVVSLLELYEMDKSAQPYLDKSLEIAHVIKDHLFETVGGVFKLKRRSQPLLIGFCHGAAGIAYAFRKLADFLSEPHLQADKQMFIESAQMLIDYEKSLKTERGWRFPDSSDGWAIWTAGMYNMAIGVSSLAKYFPGDSYLDESICKVGKYTAIRMMNPFGTYDIFETNTVRFNYGIADVRVELDRLKLVPTDWVTYVDELYESLLEDNLTFFTVNPKNGFKPGIQGGYAGAGYFIMQLLKPGKYKSLLIK